VSDEYIPLPRLILFYAKYLDNQDTASFISNVSRFYTIGTLQRLTSSDRGESRRAAALALGFLGDIETNRTFAKLLCDKDKTVRLLAENGIRAIWTRAGSDANRQMLRNVLRLTVAKQYEEAVAKATELISLAPRFAEAWNQRAIAHFALHQYQFALEDGLKALKLNRYHFAAAAGIGHAHLFLGNVTETIRYFQLALEINPNLETIRESLSKLVQKLKEE